MKRDEEAIREWQEAWIRLSMAGDVDAMAPLMHPDVVFYVVGRPPIRGREEFLALMRGGVGNVRIESTANMETVTVVGDVAYCASHLRVAMISEAGSAGSSMRRAGYAVSILRRTTEGRWVLVCDANMLSPENPS